MADLVTRLLLNSSQFDNNIRNSTQQIQQFQNAGRALAGTITNFAGVLGIAVGAAEVFDTAINSNTLTQEAFGSEINTAKESVDSFFTALASGDWSLFENGITNAIKLSRQYQQALRQLRTSVKIGDVRISQDEKELNRLENLAANDKNSNSEREKAFAEFKVKGNEIVAYTEKLSKFVNDRLNEMLNGKGIKPTDDVRQMIFKYLDPSTTEGQLLKKYEELYNKIQSESSTATGMATSPMAAQFQAQAIANVQKYTKEINTLKKEFPELENAFKLRLNFGTEEELDELLDITDKIIGYEDRIETAKKQITDLSKDFDSNGNLIKDTKEKIKAGTKAGVKEATKEVKLDPIKVPLRFLTKEDLESSINKMVRSDLESGKIQIKGVDPKETQANLDYMASLNGIATVMGSVTNMTNEGAAGWIQYSANVINSVAAMLPVLANLFGIEAALGVAKQAKLVFPMNVIAMAATTAGLIAALASVPKFATGGIVEGSRTFGDFNLARVNSGEMILNKHQQGNLFGMLNTGSSSLNGGSVKFKIEGKDLVGVLGSYNSKVSKYR